MSDRNLKLYEDCLNDLKNLLEEKEENLKYIVNILNRSEKNCFEYLKLLLSKDDIIYKIEHVLEKIDRATKDLENEKLMSVTNVVKIKNSLNTI